MSRVATGLLMLLLGAGLAHAYTAEEDRAYQEAYAQCREKGRTLAPSDRRDDVALEHVGYYSMDGVRYHAYLGCRDALAAKPSRTVLARLEAEARHQAGVAKAESSRSPLGEYTWVLIADVLIGIVLGTLVYRPARRTPHSRRDEGVTGGQRILGGLMGALAALVIFAGGFVLSIFLMFLAPVSPMELFVLTGAGTALSASVGLRRAAIGWWP